MYSLLDIGDHLSGIGLVPAAIKVLRGEPELDNKIAGQILRLDLAALLAPEADQSSFIVAHDDPGVRTPDEITAITPGFCPHV